MEFVQPGEAGDTILRRFRERAAGRRSRVAIGRRHGAGTIRDGQPTHIGVDLDAAAEAIRATGSKG